MKITAIHLTPLDKRLVKKAVEEYQNENLSIGDGVFSNRKKLCLTDAINNVLTFDLMAKSRNDWGQTRIEHTKVTVEL